MVHHNKFFTRESNEQLHQQDYFQVLHNSNIQYSVYIFTNHLDSILNPKFPVFYDFVQSTTVRLTNLTNNKHSLYLFVSIKLQ